jgi:hypothetical protein
MLGLGIIFSHDIQRFISNDRPMESFQAIKIDKYCKHLLNFPTVTLRASIPLADAAFVLTRVIVSRSVT